MLEALVALAAPTAVPAAEEKYAAQGSADEALLKALPGSRHTLADGLSAQSQGGEVPISAKFELENGKLNLSVYTAGKGTGVDAEHNVLKEYAGSAAEAKWQPEVEVFKDVEHVARSATQLTLLQVSGRSLMDVLKEAQRDQKGTVFSVQPMVENGKPGFQVLIAEGGKVKKVVYGLRGGKP